LKQDSCGRHPLQGRQDKGEGGVGRESFGLGLNSCAIKAGRQ
jgi:hypothetical protein